MLFTMNAVSHNFADILRAQKEASRRSLHEFIKLAWPRIDSEKYVDNWHMGAICEHLEAVAAGDINRLVINVPPGTSKSSATCVFFPAWLWGPRGLQHWKILTGSFSEDNAKRDNRRTRELVRSNWFQRRWPLHFTKTEETYVENEHRGFRESKSITGMTGKRGNVVVWDDPLNVEAANSPKQIKTASRILQETLTTRMISPEHSAFVLCMQRLNELDPTGFVIANDLGYTQLLIPMEFEPNRKFYNALGWTDPRKKAGELLDPVRFPKHVLERDKKQMGQYAVAGQFQQRPAPRGGGLFKKKKLQQYIKLDDIPKNTKWVRGWDLAGTKDEDAAFTAGVLMGRTPELPGKPSIYIIKHVCRDQLEPQQVEELLKEIATEDGKNVKGSIPQDPGSAGKHVAISLITGPLAGYPYFYSTESGDKEMRAQPFAAQVNAGNVYLVKGVWNRDFVDEASVFPAGQFKDQVDAASRAFMELTGAAPTTAGLKGKYGAKARGR